MANSSVIRYANSNRRWWLTLRTTGYDPARSTRRDQRCGVSSIFPRRCAVLRGAGQLMGDPAKPPAGVFGDRVHPPRRNSIISDNTIQRGELTDPIRVRDEEDSGRQTPVMQRHIVLCSRGPARASLRGGHRRRPSAARWACVPCSGAGDQTASTGHFHPSLRQGSRTPERRPCGRRGAPYRRMP